LGVKVVLSGEGADEILVDICILEMHLRQRIFKGNHRKSQKFIHR
jgi:asparagine synthetase B (glutamine-hydrolysing)